MTTLNLYYDAGLGDVLHRLHGDENFNKISMADRVNVLMASHNPYAYELFAYHPCNYKIRIIHAGHKYADLWNAGVRNQDMVEKLCQFHDFPIPPHSDISNPSRITFNPGPDTFRPTQPYIVLAPDAAGPHKSISADTIFTILRYIFNQLPGYQVYILTRTYFRTLGTKDFKGRVFGNSNECLSLELTVPTTFFLTQKASAVISCHSALAQLAGFSDVPSFILHPPMSDFNEDNFGKGYTFMFSRRPDLHMHAEFDNWQSTFMTFAEKFLSK